MAKKDYYRIGDAVKRLHEMGLRMNGLITKIRFYEKQGVFSWTLDCRNMRTDADQRFYKDRDVEEMFLVFQLHGLLTLEGLRHKRRVYNLLQKAVKREKDGECNG